MNGTIPRLYQNADVNMLDDDLREELGTLPNWPFGLVLEGSNGSGKTYAACAVANRAFDTGRMRRPTVFLQAADIPVLWGEIDTYRDQRWSHTLSNSSCLIIDDLGKENRLTDYQSGKSVQIIGTLLRHRVQKKLSTIITTNMDPIEIQKEYGTSIDSLLEELSDAWVIMEGADRRRQKKEM